MEINDYFCYCQYLNRVSTVEILTGTSATSMSTCLLFLYFAFLKLFAILMFTERESWDCRETKVNKENHDLGWIFSPVFRSNYFFCPTSFSLSVFNIFTIWLLFTISGFLCSRKLAFGKGDSKGRTFFQRGWGMSQTNKMYMTLKFISLKTCLARKYPALEWQYHKVKYSQV